MVQVSTIIASIPNLGTVPPMLEGHLNEGVLLQLLINFGFIALLPRKFFRQGAKLDANFWLTAAPLFVCPALLALTYFGFLPSLVPEENPWSVALALLAVVISCVSIVFLGMAIGTHRVPIHMFHDKEDKTGVTSHLVTYGPYRYIRHPIYSAYLMALFGSMVFCPQIGTILCWIYGSVVLGKTAAQEEVKLCESSDLGPEYREYMKVTGRFLPPLSAFTLQSTPHPSNEAPSATSVESKASSDR
jgi:protein-S-isoprenylcysteine O-methyltransferase Ste14